MSDLKLLMAIVRRKYGDDFLDLFLENEVPMVMSTLCEGTAQPTLLEALGLVPRDLEMHGMIVTQEKAQRLLRRMVKHMHINIPGSGIAFTVPMDSIENSEVTKMDAYPYSLIIAIASRGYSNKVMDAARAAGARGGTVVHAKGTGAHLAATSFFGISIAEEREMFLIVAPAADREPIMTAISENAGKHTPAQAIVFSLPVEAAEGLRLNNDDED